MKNILAHIVLLGSLMLMLQPFQAHAFTKIPPPENIKQLWTEFSDNKDVVFSDGQFPFQQCFKDSAKQHRLPLAFLLAVAQGESHFNAKAKSKANAYGVMQIQWPGTAKDLGFKSIQELYDPCLNINGGARYLRQLLDRYKGSYHYTLAAYNYGMGRIKAGERAPDGARWYSGYIYAKLDNIVTSGQSGQKTNFSKQQQKFIHAPFVRPYRAEKLAKFYTKKFPSIKFDWFSERINQNGKRNYHIVLMYANDAELKRSMKKLRDAGFIQ